LGPEHVEQSKLVGLEPLEVELGRDVELVAEVVVEPADADAGFGPEQGGCATAAG
jgi:hypothetical protein